jgi:benzoate 4-monooxygenase
MAVTEYLLTPYAPIVALAIYLFLPYLLDTSTRKIPAPTFAALTNAWLFIQARRGRRYLAVDEAHKKMGKLVRIAPNHVSIADDSAINAVYGHGNGFLKSDYYDAFVSIRRGLFNTRDRAEHTRKRKTIAHTFSTKSIAQFEEYMQSNLGLFVKQWDGFSDAAKKAGDKYYRLDALNWFNYLAFDIIGDLAFGQPFGMLRTGEDKAEMKMSPTDPVSYVPAVEVLNRRGEVSGTLGTWMAIRPLAPYLPDKFFSEGLEAVQNLAGMAIARVSARLDGEAQSERVDLLARLMEGKDESGAKLGREELTAEALTQLIAGSDTTSNTSCAILYWVLKTPGVLKTLQAELDAAIPAGQKVPTFGMVKDLPYTKAVIQETMRIHSTSSLGLPRVVPPGPGVAICGHHFPAGSVVSVPSYTIHRSTEIWGPDAAEFRPERWLGEKLTDRQKAAFIPFSYGPRSCVGRNVAEMELALIVGTVFRRYEFELETQVMETREGFLRKPLELWVGVRKRANVE